MAPRKPLLSSKYKTQQGVVFATPALDTVKVTTEKTGLSTTTTTFETLHKASPTSQGETKIQATVDVVQQPEEPHAHAQDKTGLEESLGRDVVVTIV